MNMIILPRSCVVSLPPPTHTHTHSTDDCSQVTVASTTCSEEDQVCIVPVPPITTTRNAGSVFLCKNGYWGTISSDPSIFWNEKNAQVACRDAGFSGSLNSILNVST